jgi:peptide/nickel transport system substrate-binding protein
MSDLSEQAPAAGSEPGELSRGAFLRRTGVAVLGASAALGAPGVALGQSTRVSAKRGGTLHIGHSAGSAQDTLDPHINLTTLDDFRNHQLYENLATFDAHFQHQLLLAEEMTLEKSDQVLVRLRKGVTFHDGTPLTVDDVIYTYKRIQNTKRAVGRPGIQLIDLKTSKKLDPLTIRFKLSAPNVSILDELASIKDGIVPVGFDPKKPNGTGPFKYQSFTPGQQSVFVRNEHYWQSGLPYLDSLVISDLADDTARLNALLGGQVDVIDGVPAAQISQLKSHSDLATVISHGGVWPTFYMRVDKPPFNDVRARQAMRLLVNRPQLIDQAISGYGRLGNDIPAIQDPLTTTRLPQRHQDLDQAKSLLKAAGMSDLKVTLVTGPAVPGMIQMSEVLAQQAKSAGVTINLQQVDTGTLFGNNFLKWNFSVDWWSTRNYLPTVALDMLPTSPYNESHWPDPEDKKYVALYNEAKRTVPLPKRKELIYEMQKMEWERGGNIIFGFVDFIDGHKKNVLGFKPNSFNPLNGYDLTKVSLA